MGNKTARLVFGTRYLVSGFVSLEPLVGDRAIGSFYIAMDVSIDVLFLRRCELHTIASCTLMIADLP